MKHTIIHACTVGPAISEEQFIPEHFFLYLVTGSMLAYITKKGKKPSDIYLDLGFEDLSHFSIAFKKLFGHAPSTLKKNDH